MNFLIIKRSILIEYLIYFHIVLITIQLAIRDLIIDTTFLRDIVLIIILFFWFFSKKSNKNFANQKKNAFEYWIRSLIIYGIIVSFIVCSLLYCACVFALPQALRDSYLKHDMPIFLLSIPFFDILR